MFSLYYKTIELLRVRQTSFKICLTRNNSKFAIVQIFFTKCSKFVIVHIFLLKVQNYRRGALRLFRFFLLNVQNCDVQIF